MSWLEKINQMKKNKEKTTEEIAQMSGIPKGTLNKLFRWTNQRSSIEHCESSSTLFRVYT